MASAEDSQRETVAFLASPAAHGGETPDRIDTHISRVFLAGETVLKLKRAVRFPEHAPILDFTTVEARLAACNAEVLVNRRTAPDLYLGIAPVLPGPKIGALIAEPQDAPDHPDALDWLVVMRRFDQAALLDDVAQRGALDAGMVAALAGSIAAFHAEAAPTPGYGGADPIGMTVNGVAAELARCAPAAVDADEAAALAGEMRAALEANRALLDDRASHGFVRHCHGDLHLRNICLMDGIPMPFDAIEFNPRIANIDVLYDLAFLLMDLIHRDLTAEANAVLNLYLPGAGGYAGLAALPLFMALRAGIRAEIAAGRSLAEEDADGALADEARGYLALARRLLEPHPPRLIAIGGLSGTGKSVMAAALAPGIGRPPGAVTIRSDVTRKRLFGLDPMQRLGAEGYTADATARTYDAMREPAGVALRAGYAVIADAVHAHPEEREAIAAVAADCGVPFTGLWLEAPETARVDRVTARRNDASDAGADIARAQGSYDPGPIGWHRIDAAQPPDAVADACRMALKQNGKRSTL